MPKIGGIIIVPIYALAICTPTIALVSEQEYEYGAEAFEVYMEKHGTKETVSMHDKENERKSR